MARTAPRRAVVCALRRSTNFALDDLTFVVRHFLPHLDRDNVWRILKAEGLNRRPKPASDRPAKGQGAFRDYDLGFVHVDIKHLPKLQTADGERRKRYLFVAIDRCSRSVHLAVKDDETERSASAFLREAAAAFPFRLSHVLTDNGSCFTPAFAKACTVLGAQYRHTRPRTPQTNGMVERFNSRVSSEVLGITIYSHHALEQLLRGFNAAYNTRRQRVLDGRTPDQLVAERLAARPELANTKPHGRAGPCDATKARFIAEAAKEVSQPDIVAVEGRRWFIEDAFETAKNELGLDHNETRSWHGWHRHVSLVMLAFVVLAVTRCQANAAAEQTPPRMSRTGARSSVGRSRRSAALPHALRSAASAWRLSSPGQRGAALIKPTPNAPT